MHQCSLKIDNFILVTAIEQNKRLAKNWCALKAMKILGLDEAYERIRL